MSPGQIFCAACGLAVSIGKMNADLLVVPNKSGNTVSILDAGSGALKASVAVGKAPHEAEILAGGKIAAVSNYGTRKEPGQTLTLIDLEKGARQGTIDLGPGARPHGLKALEDGRLLVTAEGSKELLIVDPRAGRAVTRIRIGREISHMVVVSGDQRRAFVANIGSGSVSVVDLAEGVVIKEIPTGKGAEGIAITPNGREVWVTNRGAGTVSILDAEALAVVCEVKAPGFPIRVKITPDGRRALVSCARSAELAVFDVASRKQIKRIAIHERVSVARPKKWLGALLPVPVGLLIAPDGKRAWVASTKADIVSEIDLTSMTVVRRLTAGKEPDGLAGRFENNEKSSVEKKEGAR